MDFAFNAAFAKATGHQDGVKTSQLAHRDFGDGFRVYVFNLDSHVVFHTGVAQCFVDRFVAVAQVHVLAHHRDGDFPLRVFHFKHQVVPALEVGGLGVQAQFVANQAVQPLFVQHARHFVNGVHIRHGNHAPLLHIGKQRNFVALVLGNVTISPAQQNVRLNTNFTQLLHGVLGGLGFKLAGSRNPGYISKVHKG